MLRVTSLLAAIGWVISCGSAASGAVVVYPHDRSGFQASLASFTTYGFEVSEGFAKGQITSFAGGAIQVCLYDEGVRLPAYVATHPYSPGTQLLLNAAVSYMQLGPSLPLRVEFSTGMRAVGFDVIDLAPGQQYTISLDTGGITQWFALGDSDGQRSTAEFWGVVSSGPIAKVDIYAIGTGMINDFPEYTDNLTVSAVPEPSGLLLVVPTILTLRRWRRRL